VKTKDLQVICEAVEVMIQLLTSLGVINQNPTIIGKIVPAAKQFAEEIMLDSSYDRVVQLTKAHQEAAQAFLLLLCVVRGEIKPEAALPASTPIGTPEMYHTAAYAIERETVAYANRRRFVTALTQ
jgi:hypothetical protein